MSESMNIEKKDNLVALVLFTCVMLLKVCTLIALFCVYCEQEAALPSAQHSVEFKVILKQ